MRRGGRHLCGRVPRQQRVRVQRNYILNGAERQLVARHGLKAIAASRQKPVEIVQLSALALMTHPFAFSGVPSTRPVKEIKRPRACCSVPRVQPLNSLHAYLQHGIVSHPFPVRIGKIREQREVQIGFTIRQVPDFQILQQPRAIGFGKQQGRNHHHGFRIAGNSIRKIHAGKHARP